MSNQVETPIRESKPPTADQWAVALEALQQMLAAHNGLVSTMALRTALEGKGIVNARDLVVALRYFDFEAPDEAIPKPAFSWVGHAKSFYTPERYEGVEREREAEASKAEAEESDEPDEPSGDDEEAPAPEKPRIRQEERRLGTYIATALEDVYQSDHAPEDAPYVFDVHSDRPGSEYENVDLIAVHWRSPKCVELVAVEVKLDFTARLVQQARNYSRFADRVWVAVPVLAEAAEASTALREYDPQLFEHIVEIGLGILACRRRPGRSYEVVPVQWPRRTTVNSVEREGFLERYREQFERASVLAPRAGRRYAFLG